MKVLIIKTSSMGDVIHTLPALTDALNAYPDIEFTWVVEEGFAQIPWWHPAVKKVLPVALRRWRKNIVKTIINGEWRAFKRELKTEQYDYVIDAQGLVKSAFITRLARGVRCGYDKGSIREPLACRAYKKTFSVSKNLHAVTRIRQLFAQALHYDIDIEHVRYDLQLPPADISQFSLPEQYCLFIPNTTWPTKHWPISYWRQLIEKLAAQNIPVVLPGGYAHELPKVEAIAADFTNCIILQKTSLDQLALIIKKAQAIVSVDTGLSHLAAAIERPTIVLYGPTDPVSIGTKGKNQIHLQADFSCAPCLQKDCTYKGSSEVSPACFTTVAPSRVWENLQPLLVAHEQH
jgi:heptosyltransferase-1